MGWDGMVWCGMLSCVTVWDGMVWCGMISCVTVWYGIYSI